MWILYIFVGGCVCVCAGHNVLQVELDNSQWSYDPHVGFTINNPSLVHDHGYYECLARSTHQYNHKNQTVSFFLIVQRKCAR